MSKTPRTNPPLDPLLVNRYVAELIHRTHENEMVGAILVVAARITAAGALDDQAKFDKALAEFRSEAIVARSNMRAAVQTKAIIEKARGGGHAH
ncbi:hypothetical protein ROE7235_03746 [Roseibaca ekhonensis]|uniref:Uncharacterized protein n=1 Tax=Roseinatronobacter ekhonensis TaxID=254356 RepID=A0A3B0MDK9_9RHOB|nr:hypothetical protein [Roseibaca ekhonensis]SUZ33965.1 hypothetical protein ROE7235_03746 [Roseibaca ekhonensis]